MKAQRETEQLADQIARIRDMEDYVPGLVKAARLAGASWADIGVALGITRQAAWKQYEYIDAQIGWRDVVKPEL